MGILNVTVRALVAFVLIVSVPLSLIKIVEWGAIKFLSMPATDPRVGFMAFAITFIFMFLWACFWLGEKAKEGSLKTGTLISMHY